MFKYAANYEYDLINLIWCHPEKTSHLLGFSGVSGTERVGRRLWPACGQAILLDVAPGRFKHFKAHSRPKTMSYDVVRCRKMSYDVNKALGMWPLKSQISPETATETGCKMLKTAKLHPVRVRCRGSLPVKGKIWKNLSFEVVCCLLLWSSANPPPPTWWVKGLVWTCRCLKGGITSTREKSLVNPPVTHLT